MSVAGLARWAGPLLCAILLAACAAPPVREPVDREAAYRDRTAQVGAWDGWSLTGRLGISMGDEGGSGRLEWRREGERSDLRFRGTLGQGAWRLTAEPGAALLEQADGTVRSADDVDVLVREATGWRVPVDGLAWWVRGLAWPDAETAAERILNADGTPSRLNQAGWTIEYSRWGEGPSGLPMPLRLEAVRGDLTVKLAISRWTAGLEGGFDG